ncbi:MAG: UPF0182 family protein [Ignavibacteriaceae bacterium]
MYSIIILILIAIAAFFLITGFKKGKRSRIVLGALIGFLTWYIFWFMDFWGDALWFFSLGYEHRFWTVILAKTILLAAGAVFGGIVVYSLILSLSSGKKYIKLFAALAGAFTGGAWGLSNWEVILKYINSVPANVSDPILNKNIGFYLFSLPFLNNIYGLLISLSILGLAACVITIFFFFDGKNILVQPPTGDDKTLSKIYKPLFINAAVFIFILAFGKFLSRYNLMYSSTGVVYGPGWTDVNILLPAYNIIIVLTLLAGLFLLVSPLRNMLQKVLEKFKIYGSRFYSTVFFAVGIFIIVIWFLGLTAIPGLFEWIVVSPNEITYERPYIINNIKYTRYGFDLNKIESKQFADSGNFTQQTVNNNQQIFSNVRLWDWRALDAVFKQFQEFRLYYEFKDVDIDRYKFDSTYKQVMISAREIQPSSLPQQSQTFVNKRFQYTHGYGLTLTTVNDFTSQGLPNLLVKDIPPVSKYPSLDVTQPRIYYGELTNSYVVVNSQEKEFDYPSGEDNAYNRYDGNGGVLLSNIWRKFLYGWKFGGSQFFFSSYTTDQSRILFYRQIEERVKNLAPFLHFDNDPYIVLAKGNLYWIIDAYTTSSYYPYSQPYSSNETIEFNEGNSTSELHNNTVPYLNGANYVRNSVKAVVNAYNGDVSFYVVDEKDPVIKVWENIFPEMFKTKKEMPEDLQAHIRYPIDYLLVQGLVYEKYHMTDPTVFYNQEDLWVRATEKYYSNIQPVQPYYIMWQLPGSKQPQFVLILPFTPKNRQVLIGWIAGMCDGKNYGKFLAYQFPKDKMVLGPQQVETKIDQDSFLSGQLSLWDQRGSQVIRGNVLAIPVDKTLFYVEPIYLQSETAAYPELRLVAVMHGENLSYAPTFDQALQGLFAKSKAQVTQQTTATASKEKIVESKTVKQQIQNANSAFENYLKYIGQKKFNDAANELQKLQQALKQLQEGK